MNKTQLDIMGTVLGVIAGISTVLGANGYLNPRLSGAITGTATVLLGVVVQKPSKQQ